MPFRLSWPMYPPPLLESSSRIKLLVPQLQIPPLPLQRTSRTRPQTPPLRQNQKTPSSSRSKRAPRSSSPPRTSPWAGRSRCACGAGAHVRRRPLLRCRLRPCAMVVGDTRAIPAKRPHRRCGTPTPLCPIHISAEKSRASPSSRGGSTPTTQTRSARPCTRGTCGGARSGGRAGREGM
ncbi:hypothetical protein DFH08DRAFT_907728 [Mycena albidolilacea]|uniref:Uncharacterized protein n=1 Tax=Mycena albidolilacea TaxID=1033008 RepID=A0AAD6YXR1_9AGAR|nr:hypothetical protein DFH08DRAFT_907728 [Mycena albidolilacea]